MKTYAIGDIHGAYKALIQCFERAKFDYEKDRLIVMGDICDGYMVGLTQMYRVRVILRRRWSGIEASLIWRGRSRLTGINVN